MALPCGRASFLANCPERKPNRVSTMFGRISTVSAPPAGCNHEGKVGPRDFNADVGTVPDFQANAMTPVLVYLLIALGAASCLYIARRERRTGEISIVRLVLPVLSAAAVAYGLVMVDRAPPPKTILAVALLAGLLIGTARGATVRVKWGLKNRFSGRGRRDLPWLSGILVTALVVRLLDVVLRPHGSTLGFGAEIVVTICFGIVLGRGALTAVRTVGRALA
jgi:hypothetical protein